MSKLPVNFAGVDSTTISGDWGWVLGVGRDHTTAHRLCTSSGLLTFEAEEPASATTTKQTSSRPTYLSYLAMNRNSAIFPTVSSETAIHQTGQTRLCFSFVHDLGVRINIAQHVLRKVIVSDCRREEATAGCRRAPLRSARPAILNFFCIL